MATNQLINAQDFNYLTFTPNTNWSGTTSFSWNGTNGTYYATSAASVNITVDVSPYSPTVSTITKSATKNTVVTFSLNDFTSHFTSPNILGLAKIKIVSLPANGALKLSGSNVTVSQEITAGNIGSLTFVPNSNWSGNTSFNWNGSSGTVYAVDAANVDIAVTAPATASTSAGKKPSWKAGAILGSVVGGAAMLL